MKHWLIKQEPTTYPFAQLVADGRTYWDGVRNHQARNNLREMRKGDLVLYYHSVKDKAIVGIARIAAEAYPDPTTDDERWVVVDVEPVRALVAPVSLAQVSDDEVLREMALVKQSRLSVMPVSAAQFKRVLELGRTKV